MTAAELLQDARLEADMSQRELARASGVAESRISDYEHGRHQPSVAMLQRLLDATGHDLTTTRRQRVDLQHNARVFADVLTLVDAIPSSGGDRPAPPTWAEITRPVPARR